MCEHKFACLGFCNVCVLCGAAHKLLKLDTYNVFSAPMSKGYSRRLRFKTKVDKILLGTPQPKFDDPVWGFLNKNKTDLVTPLCIQSTLKKSRLTCKHYDNIKLFCDVFTSFTIRKEKVDDIHRYMMAAFNKIHNAWNFSKHPGFFSYTWLIRYLLDLIQSEYVVYLKAPTSAKRHEKYKTLLDQIIPPGKCDEMLNRVLANNHFQSA